MGKIYAVCEYLYRFARGDIRAAPEGSDVFIRRINPRLNIVYHVRVGRSGRGMLTHLYGGNGTAWADARGDLQVETGNLYACIWVPRLRETLLTPFEVSRALSGVSGAYLFTPEGEHRTRGTLLLHRYQTEPPTSTSTSGLDIDWEYIFNVWEGNHPEGEVPGPTSGVTIAAGYDLKEKTVESLRQTGVFTNEQIQRLRPFLSRDGRQPGPVGNEARSRLAQWRAQHHGAPLIDAETASRLNQQQGAARGRRYALLYDQVSRVVFAAIPPAAQTIIASVLYQYGSPGPVPWMWRPAIRQDWETLITALRAQTHYTGRRRGEAAYLEHKLAPATPRRVLPVAIQPHRRS